MPTKRKEISADRLRELLEYFPETGEFRRSTGKYRGRFIVGSPCNLGYLRIFVNGQTYYAHRLAWIYTYGSAPVEIDHINLNKADNRISNLRAATRRENRANTFIRSRLGYKGIAAKKHRWAASIKLNGKSKHLGSFTSAEEASDAYKAAALRFYGEFARFE